MMKRAHVDEYYTAYLDGSLPQHLRQAVEAHLRACPHCAAELEELRLMLDDLAVMPAPELPADFTAGVRARLTSRPRSRNFSWRIPVLATGTLAAAMGLVLVLTRLPRTPEADGPSTMRSEQAAPSQTPEQSFDARTRQRLPASPPMERLSEQPAPSPHDVLAKSSQTVARPLINRVPAPKKRAQRHNASPVGPSPAKAGRIAAEPIVIALAPPRQDVDAIRMMRNEATPGAVLEVDRAHAEMDAPPLLKGPGGPQGSLGSPGSPGEQMVSVAKSCAPGGVCQLPEGAGLGNVSATSAIPDAAAVTSHAFDMSTLPVGGKRLSGNAYGAITLAPLSELNKADGKPRWREQGKEETVIATDERKTGMEFGYINDGQERLVQIRTAHPGQKLSIRYADATDQTGRIVPLPNETANVLLKLPQLPQGAVLRLSVTGNTRAVNGGECYLVVPDSTRRQETVAVQLDKQPRLQALRQIVNAGGLSLLVPVSFADEVVTLSMPAHPPLTALQTLVSQGSYRIDVTGSLVNILSK